MNCSLCNLAGYVIELPEDDVLTLKHVRAMECGNRLTYCHNSVHLVIYCTCIMQAICVLRNI
jgi:hypothetical protein